MTTLFQKSKFFQSNQSNVENNPNSLNLPTSFNPNGGNSSHYGHNQ